METTPLSPYQLPNRRGWYYTAPKGARVGPFFSQMEAEASQQKVWGR